MIIYNHKDCGEPAVEIPDDFAPEMPTVFPFSCLYCLQEIEDESDLMVMEQMRQ
jgi:hypothetical protein